MPELKAAIILIIEDDPAIAQSQQQHLERAGYATRAAASADAALAELRRQRPDLILLDYQLPGALTGLAFIERLKQEGLEGQVVVVTDPGEENTAIEALRAGVRDFLLRTSDYLDHLAATIARVLRQMQTEHRLAESEARLAAIIDSAKDAVIVIESDRRITLFNAAAERMFGCRAAEALGQKLTRFIPDEYQPAPAATPGRSTTMLLRSGTQGVRAGGERFPLELAVSPVQVGGRRFYTMLVRDITERVRAEKRLRDQAALLEKATDAIFVRDLNGTIRFWNPSAERLYGWTAAEAVGRNSAELLYRGPSSAFVEEAAVRTRGEWTGELHQVTRDGKDIVVSSRWTLMRGESVGEEAVEGPPDNPTILIINTDITARKTLESQLQRAQRLESIGVLAGGIAHDLNNVLTPILMASELLLLRVSDPESRSLLAMLQSATERGAELVNQILTFARGTEGERQELYLPPLFKEVGKLLGQTLPKSITIELNVPQDLWLISGDATQTHQILTNLCVNARDAMPQGGTLTLSARNEVMDAARAGALHPDARPGAYVVLAVRDTGTGIAPEILDHIFDPFFTTKEVGKGTGLGLSTTLGIVKSSGGFVTVWSEVSQGALFEVYLPAYEPPAVAPPAARPTDEASHGELILLVDDEASIREVGRAILEANGYRVMTAANGVEGVTLYTQHQGEVRAVLTDMAMPIMDGPALVRALTQQDPQVRIVVASGFPGPEAPASLPGVLAVLPKPYSVESLLRTMRQVLAQPAGSKG
jgi:PAS domain S-box-containing protein